MSYLDIENQQGARYRVRKGWDHPPLLPRAFAESKVDLQLLLGFDEAAIEQIYDQFLFFEQRLPDPTGPRYRNPHESHHPLDPYAGAPPGVTGRRRDIYRALADQRLIIEENPFSEEELTEQQSLLLRKIHMALRQIIAQERAEAAHHTRMLAQESRVNRALIYTGAFFNGLWNAGVDLAKWAKEVNDVINPTQRLLRSMHASHRALQRSRENGESILTAYLDEHLKGEKRELVQALGFDPTAITQEQFDQAMEIADLVWENQTLRTDLIRFAKDYVQAQHAIELTNLSGSAAFEILFTIVLAAVTAGAGLAASAASQARHLAKFRKVGDLLMEFAEHVKKVRQRLRRRSAKGNNGSGRSFDQLPVDEVDAPTKPTVHPDKKSNQTSDDRDKDETPRALETNPDDIRTASKHWNDEKASRFKTADEFYESVGYKDYDSHLRGVDFSDEVEVIELKKGDKIYQYSYLDRKTGEPRVGSYFYNDKDVDVGKLGFEVDGREMIELEVLEDGKVLRSKAANIEDWNGSGKIFPGGETQLFSPNLKLSAPTLVE